MGGEAIGVLGAVPVVFVLLGLVLPGSHGGLATVADVPLGRDMLPDATVELEVAPTPLLVLEPVLPVVEVVLLGEIELVEPAVPVAPLLEGVHGATVVVVRV